MDFLKDVQGHEDVVDAYTTFRTSDITPLICFTNKSKDHDLRLVTVSCDDANGNFLGTIVIVGDEILPPGYGRTVAIESKQWKIARFQFHALYREGSAAWRPAHSSMYTHVPREIVADYLGTFASEGSIAEPRFSVG